MNMSENTEAGGLVDRLRGIPVKWIDLRLGEEAADAIEALSVSLASERAAHAETKRERDELKADIDSYAETSSNLATELYKTEDRLAEALKALEPFAVFSPETEALNYNWVKLTYAHGDFGQLSIGDFRDARRVREGGEANG